MKRLAIIGSALALALAVSTAPAQNLLLDGSFEGAAFGQPNPIPVPGGVGGGWAAFSGTLTTAAAHSGSQSVNLWDNSWSPSGVYQIVNATAGLQYTASAYFNNTGVASGWGTPYLINLEFHDAAGAQVGTTASTGWTADTVNQWKELSAVGIAPAGTAYAYVYFMAMNSVVTGANFYVDDASLTTPVPEPSSLMLLGLGLAGTLIWRRR